jgi:UDP-glucose:(heptosyl)LPS alpha-1,3-glucosyltransferase
MRLAVCYQVVDPRLGGAETYVVDLCRGLVRSGHSVDLLAERWDPTSLPDGVRAIRVPVVGRTRLGLIWNFAERCDAALRDARPAYDVSIGFINTWGQDILIPQGGVRAASLAANAERFAHPAARAAYRVLKRLNPKWWTYQAIERRQYDPSRGSHFVAVSRMVLGHMKRYHGVGDDRVTVIPNAIDESRVDAADRESARSSFRSRLGVRESDAVGLFVAHNYRLKGLDPLLRAMALQSSATNVHLAVCGGGDPAPYRRMARRLSLEGRVHFPGYLPDVGAGYQGSDFLVLPSYYDPCSLVVFEALAAGLPVITTRRNGAGEAIEEGREGFIVDRPDDINAVARALDAMGDPIARHAMATAARELGREQTFDHYMRKLLGLIDRVAATMSSPAGRGPRPTATRALSLSAGPRRGGV